MRRSHKLILVGLAIVGFVLYGWTWLTGPKINSAPSRKVVIRGVFPFEQGLELRFRQGFHTRSPLCAYTARAFLLFSQAVVSREVVLPPMPVKRVSANRYEFEYFVDYLSPGICDWALRFVHFSISSDGRNVGGAALLGFPEVVNSIEFACFYPSKKTEVASATLVCLQQSRGTHDSKADEAKVNFFWKENTK
jgi:hypothetical protein